MQLNTNTLEVEHSRISAIRETLLIHPLSSISVKKDLYRPTSEMGQSTMPSWQHHWYRARGVEKVKNHWVIGEMAKLGYTD